MRVRGPVVACALVLNILAASPVGAQEGQTQDKKEEKPSAVGGTVRKAGDIASQPAKDVGISKSEIPPVLAIASEDPYSTAGLKGCRQIKDAVADLNEVLGPDFSLEQEKAKENRAGKLAEAGGKTVVNALIPFRGLVREISGAAPAERRLAAAIDAGYARRGFLRGLQHARKCR
ncbi:MAG: hypothetical protein DI547_12905 [Sphingobium sp.]|nr:MAG: hypothetical protein DI547_12905 [Sphingobium sp.]